MNHNDLVNLEGIFALRAIYICGGKKKAAEALSSSIDTINKHVKLLEENLNTKLIIDSKTGTFLTPEGTRVLECMNSLDILWDKLRQEKENKKDVSGTVTIGLGMGISTYFFPEEIMNLFDKYPNLKLNILQMEEQPKGATTNYDITLSYSPFESGDMIPVYKKELKCGYFVSARYLAKYGYPKDFADMIANHRMVSKKNVMSYNASYRKSLNSGAKIRLMSDLSNILLYSVQYGAGICVAPLKFKEGGAVCLDNIPCDTVFTVYLSAHRMVKDTPRVRAVIDYCKDVIAAMEAD